MKKRDTLNMLMVATQNSIMATSYLIDAMKLEHSVEKKQLINYARDSLQRALDEIEPLQDQWE